jgi:predicted ATPase
MTAVSQPVGTVTLVFSDIEGSTKLLEELGTDAYRDALAEHRRIVREAYGRYSGYEVDYEGDAFFYTFASASDAVAAVAEAMAGLADGPIAIRVGIHTGTPAPDPPKYVGMDVHFAARVMSSAHGGQVVCSAATAAVVDPELTELGEHRLKDISEAVALFQLGEGSFPPLKTISNTNLPRPASSFLGREAELAQVLARIEQGARLLTLTGPGGTGKTRLALEAASSLVGAYKAGVFWVGLATLRDPTLVTETIAQTLGAKDDLASHIGERQMLLLLDNLEQVIESAPDLSALLGACPNLTLLVTSRELLRISGEVEYAVPPLAEPEALALFCERAQLEPSAEIAELCARLDSLPLAVELAAARTKALSPQQILERLSQRLDLLTGGRDADPRQQTLRATIEWSYELLSPEEQALFVRLSVFSGGCTLEAAEEVADADLDTLQSLVEKSLVRFSTSVAGSRYWMLETIRGFSRERLEADDDADSRRRRHAKWITTLAGHQEGVVSGDESAFESLASEQENVRAALAWSLASGETETGLELVCGPVSFYWWVRGLLREGNDWLKAFLAADGGRSPELNAQALTRISFFASELGDSEEAIGSAEAAVALWAEIGDADWLVRSLNGAGNALTSAGRFGEAVQRLDEAIDYAKESGLDTWLVTLTVNKAQALIESDRRHEARDLLSGELNRSRDGTPLDVHAVLALVGLLDAYDGRDEAVDELNEALAIALEVGFVPGAPPCLSGLAVVAAQGGSPREAVLLASAAEALEEHSARPSHHVLSARSEALAAAAERLDPLVYTELRESGAIMKLDEIIQVARSLH